MDFTTQLKTAYKTIIDYDLASVSLICRKHEINFNEAIKIIDELERLQLIGPFRGSQQRLIKQKNYKLGLKTIEDENNSNNNS